MDSFNRPSPVEGVADIPDSGRVRGAELNGQLILGHRRGAGSQVETTLQATDVQGAKGFHERLLKGSAYSHSLADTLHGGCQDGIRTRELFKGETRNFGHNVVESGFEGGRGGSGDIVLQLVQGVAHRQFGRDFGNGVAGGFRGEGGGAGDPGIHLNDDHASSLGANGELDVGATRFDADFPDDGKGGVAHPLIFAIGQSLGRGDGDTVPGMDSHRIKVFNGADDDAVVRVVPHHLHLILFPAEKRLLDQDFGCGGGVEPRGRKLLKLLPVVSDSASGSPQGECGSDDEREGPDLCHGGAGLVQGVGRGGACALQADFCHTLLEELAILPLANGFNLGTNELYAVFREGARLVQGHGGIQGRLAAQCRQEGVRFFLCHDHLHDGRGNGFDVGAIGKLRIGHDRGRVAVHEDDLVSLLPERLAGLDTGVVEFAGLANDDGTRADDEDRLDVGAAWHAVRIRKRVRPRRGNCWVARVVVKNYAGRGNQ